MTGSNGSWLTRPIFLLLDGRKVWVSTAAVIVLGSVTVADALLLAQLLGEASTPLELTTGSWPRGVGIRLRVDGLSLLCGAVSAAALTCAMLHEARSRVRSRLLPALLLALCTGLHGAFFTGDLFNFYVFFELSMIASFALAAYGFGRAEIRGAFIYVIVNFFGSILFLLGITVIYYLTGTLDLGELEQIQAQRAGSPEAKDMLLPGALLLASLTIKLGLFPFHGWVPVLYSHARPAVAAALAGALVNIGSLGLLKIGYSVLDHARDMAAALLMGAGIAAVLYGSMLALVRGRADEVLAYLAIAHSGFLVFAFGVGGVHGTTALVLGIAAGSFDKAAMFLALDAAPAARSPIAFVSASSTAGMPLTLGFVFKVELMRAALTAGVSWLVIALLTLAMIALMGTVFRFWRLAKEQTSRAGDSSVAPILLACASVAFGVLPDPIHEAALSLAGSLHGVDS